MPAKPNNPEHEQTSKPKRKGRPMPFKIKHGHFLVNFDYIEPKKIDECDQDLSIGSIGIPKRCG